MNLSVFYADDDFFTDRLCRRYGPLVFVSAAILIAGAFASPWAFSCWTPTHFTGSHDGYTNNACRNNGKFYLPFTKYIPSNENNQREFNLNKIRYLPVLLILQITVFLIPRVFWKAANIVSGYHADRIVKASYRLSVNNTMNTRTFANSSVLGCPASGGSTGTMQNTTNEATAGYHPVASHFISVLERPFPCLGDICSMCGGYVLVFAYLFTKIGYLLTSIVQIAILGGVLGTNFFTLLSGASLWDTVIATKGEDWNSEAAWYDTELFPRTVLCDISVSSLFSFWSAYAELFPHILKNS